MLEIAGYQLDIISFIPAIIGVLLSVYNYYKMSRPAHIVPTEVVNYGLLSSSYEQSFKIILPLVFHNEGAKKGIIKNIKFGFKTNGKTTYLDTLVKAHLFELTDDLAQLCDWNKFIEHGYRVINPTFPITVMPESSVDVAFVGTALIEDNTIPLDQQSEYFIEVYYGKNKVTSESYSFFLDEEEIPDDRLVWLNPSKLQ